MTTVQRLRVYGLEHADLPSSPLTIDGPCTQPIVLWDTDEGRPLLVPCRQAGSICPACSKGRAREVQRVAHTGVLTQLRSGRRLTHVTFTAPGNPGHRRFIPGRPGIHPICGCELKMPHGLAVWNGEAGDRWNHLRTALAREYSGFEFFRGVEPQDGKRRLSGRGRMALHFHVLIASDNSLDPLAVQRFALAAGFGCNVHLDEIAAGPDSFRAASYASKYVTKCADTRPDIPWIVPDKETGEWVKKRATYRAWSQSQGFGCRMKEHRAAVVAQRRKRAQDLRMAEAVALVADVLGGLVLDVAEFSPD